MELVGVTDFSVVSPPVPSLLDVRHEEVEETGESMGAGFEKLGGWLPVPHSRVHSVTVSLSYWVVKGLSPTLKVGPEPVRGQAGRL